MAVDTPAKIAILGAGPIGLEAALYARYLGYEVDLYERGAVLEQWHRWAHAPLVTPWSRNVTPLGVAALRAQDDAWRPAADDALLTAGEFAARYLQPLAGCDLLADCLLERTTVVGVGREGILRDDLVGDERRIDVPFRILVRDAEGRERIERADVVVDCTGVLATPNPTGNGGLPAVGETACAQHIDYELPDVLGRDREAYADRTTLVVGDAHGAALTVVQLAQLCAVAPRTEVVWTTCGAGGERGPMPVDAGDPFPARAALYAQANELTRHVGGPVVHLPQTYVEAVEYEAAEGRFRVESAGLHAGHRTFDRIVAQSGHRADARLYAELNVALAAATEPVPLVQTEPDFYVLGAKSFDRRPGFTLAEGHDQIRRLFAVVGDRENLNLYAKVR